MRLIAVTALVMACGTPPPRPVAPAPAPAPVVSPPPAPVVDKTPQQERRDRAALLADEHGLAKDTAIWVVQLEEAQLLILGPIGPTGSTSGLETAARMIADQPDARAAAAYLIRHGTGAPRLYGLWILAAVDPAAATAAAKRLRRDHTKVGSLRGCLRSPPEPFADLVDEVLARPLRTI